MYHQFFEFTEAPFSITPDPRFLFLSAGHEDALAHLSYGISEAGSGGFVALTGEVGTGKTTLSRRLLEQLPTDTRVALILNPSVGSLELLESICQELRVSTRAAIASPKRLVDRLNRYLLKAHSAGLTVVLIVDEAQNLSRDALEQIRLLTNLETPERKLLQIILLGQPELRDMLLRPDLRQLNQRITARYHLMPLNGADIAHYTRHRLAVAGANRDIFNRAALRVLHRTSGGVPRLINVIAERALLAAYAEQRPRVGMRHVRLAAEEVLARGPRPWRSPGWRALGLALVLAVASTYLGWRTFAQKKALPVTHVGSQTSALSPATIGVPFATAWREFVAHRGLTPTNDEACPTTGTLRCMAAQGSIASLEQVDRAVIVALPDERFSLLEISGLDVVLRANGATRRLSRDSFEALWDGRFWDAWEMPGYVPELLQEGDRGPGVLWVKAAASKALPPYRLDPSDPYFGPALRHWATQFQRRLGLIDDGKVGLETLRMLSRFVMVTRYVADS